MRGAVTRRDLLLTAAGVIVPPLVRTGAAQAVAAATGPVERALAALESRAGGRLGVCLLDTASGRLAGHRLDERVAMCSTFKLPLAALVLREADAGRVGHGLRRQKQSGRAVSQARPRLPLTPPASRAPGSSVG
jgi:beta-lactamase class A